MEPTPADPIVVTVAGILRQFQQGWSISSNVNGQDNLDCQIYSEDAAYRPNLDEIVTVRTVSDNVLIYGGLIQAITEKGIEDPGGTPIYSRISALSFDNVLSRRLVTATIPTGTLKAALQFIVTNYLSAYGVTLNAGQPNGPTLPDLKYDLRKVEDILNEFSTLSGYVYDIDTANVLFMFLPGSNAAPFNIALGDGNVDGDITVDTARTLSNTNYANRIFVRGGTTDAPITAMSENVTEQGLHGLWEDVVSAPTATDATTAQALADAILPTRIVILRRVKYGTYRKGLRPGQTQVINSPKRNFNNTCMITTVVTQADKEGTIRYDITAIEGSVYYGNWRDVYQQWSGSYPQVFTLPGVGGSLGQKAVYSLGTSLTEFVSSPTPTWVAASAAQPKIDTVARGTTAYTARLRIRAMSGNVQARIWNVTDGVSVGVSSVVSTSIFSSVNIVGSLTPGSKVYELQLLPSVANEDVSGAGYLE